MPTVLYTLLCAIPRMHVTYTMILLNIDRLFTVLHRHFGRSAHLRRGPLFVYKPGPPNVNLPFPAMITYEICQEKTSQFNSMRSSGTGRLVNIGIGTDIDTLSAILLQYRYRYRRYFCTGVWGAVSAILF